jgi:hypothetical protein
LLDGPRDAKDLRRARHAVPLQNYRQIGNIPPSKHAEHDRSPRLDTVKLAAPDSLASANACSTSRQAAALHMGGGSVNAGCMERCCQGFALGTACCAPTKPQWGAQSPLGKGNESVAED